MLLPVSVRIVLPGAPPVIAAAQVQHVGGRVARESVSTVGPFQDQRSIDVFVVGNRGSHFESCRQC